MVIWTPADSGRGGGSPPVIHGDFSECRLREAPAPRKPSPDLLYIDLEDAPCRPRAVADEDWCGLDAAAGTRRNFRR